MKCDLCLPHGQRVELFLILSLFLCLTRSLSCGMQSLSCNMWALAPRPGTEPGPSALGMRRISHFSTRGSPESRVPIGKQGTTCTVGFLCPSLPHCHLHSTSLTTGSGDSGEPALHTQAPVVSQPQPGDNVRRKREWLRVSCKKIKSFHSGFPKNPIWLHQTTLSGLPEEETHRQKSMNSPPDNSALYLDQWPLDLKAQMLRLVLVTMD